MVGNRNISDLSSELTAAWARCRDFIAEGVAKVGGFTVFNDIEKGVLFDRSIGFMCTPREGKPIAAILTQVRQTPHGKAFILFNGGGDVARLIHEEAENIDAIARDLGCNLVGVEAAAEDTQEVIFPDYEPHIVIASRVLKPSPARTVN